MGMRIGIRGGHAASKMSTATLLAMVVIALVVSSGDVTGQRSTKTAEQSPPMFTAIDLNPTSIGGDSHAVGISGEQQVGYAERRDRQPTAIHALLWRGSAANVIDLNPGGFGESKATGICGNQQVGRGSTIGKIHALLWNGSASSVVDLTPSGFDAEASGTSGEQQVGNGSRPATDEPHALLWRGTASSVVDLHPRGFAWSRAYAVSGGQQVGMGKLTRDFGPLNAHALLWRGSAASVVDLHPSGFLSTSAWGVGGGQQVGYGIKGNPDKTSTESGHALLWRGSAASVVDLGPGSAAATNGVEQVGRVGAHAALWRGSAASVVDLQTFLPPGYGISAAFGIDVTGDVVGEAFPPTTGELTNSHAFLWRRNVPKPATSQQSIGQCK